MHLAEIDQISISGDSLLHKARAVSKLILTTLLLASFILTNDAIKLGVLMGVVFALFLFSKVPLHQLGHLILYPVFFSIFFAILRLQQSWVLGLIVLQKAVGAAMTMILLISTTPYVDVFAVLSLFMPKLLVDILLFTYRSLFILIGQIENLLKSIKLRGGYRPFSLIANLRNIAGAFGILIIHSFEMSDRMYKIYSLRGYQGGIPVTVDIFPLRKVDYIIIILGFITLAGVVIPWSLS
ncbi:energy-coupling factor transporter transmembrane component T family protein [Alkaliphilus hydrothermalis]|uniref:Cobalt/nickel transport system permease protein n=1 Tax=Alkaliphilus hydrothermalis TaxID=1482730 RepID=A0ABS2NMD0_9FIRM|nr:energy-coupling factor transporter transmembrane component T [Alkaliphilus hydrothermalis]MBM7614108.1 cobalt/nickel transport system permease protein [Alkaliphilus hydrothermalis]